MALPALVDAITSSVGQTRKSTVFEIDDIKAVKAPAKTDLADISMSLLQQIVGPHSSPGPSLEKRVNDFLTHMTFN